ncbi:hypothetical protein CDL15_Pgr019141 [Punica granatum]|uniref:Disease resistance protein At4g27190-like leucine-rich repeats domain-containing protein n=1 Tax=Punica granatum TaxID=22663 RepID=A0A218XKM5_PUNGR|nr:hypothetical protein CDL15_Pgr019141 [Punica granatum]
MNRLVTLFPSGTACSFQNLEVLKIGTCSALEVVYEIEENAGSDLSVTKLKKLSLTDLANLQHIWRRDPRGILSFQNLSSVTVMGCSSLGYLFHASVAKALVQLVELEVRDSSLEVVAAEDKGVPPASVLEFVFPRVTKLELSDLPQLKSFYPGKYISRWPSLRELMISKSSKVEIFAFDSKKSQAVTRNGNQAEQPLLLVDKVLFPSLQILVLSHMESLSIIWHDLLAEKSFDQLRDVKIDHCKKLMRIFPPKTTLERFRNLEKLRIAYCDSLEGVFDIAGRCHDPVIKMSLRALCLSNLPKLLSMCNADIGGTISFDDLKPVQVIACPKLEISRGIAFTLEESQDLEESLDADYSSD